METLGTGVGKLNIKFQIGSDRTITFAFPGQDISTWSPTLTVKRFSGDRLSQIALSIGAGLNIPIYTDNISSAFTGAATSLEEGEYHWELRRTDVNKSVISGLAYFTYDAEQGTEDGTVTVNMTTTTITVTNSGSGGHIIQDNGTSKTQRAKLNFIGFTIADDIVNNATKVTASLSGIDAVTVSTASAIITLDLNNQTQRMFRGSASIGAIKTWALSNDTAALFIPSVKFTMTTTNDQTFPATFKMATFDANWNSATKKWTPPDVGTYEMSATFDGANWLMKIQGPY